MANIRTHRPVKLTVALLSGDEDLLRRARQMLSHKYGSVDLESDMFDFVETDYYESEMGPHLKRWFLSFEKLIRADDLPQIKRETNKMEAAIADDCLNPNVSRPVNIDPGYIDVAKLILASTKNHAHRVYIADGIYGEVTLRIGDGQWQTWPWTYPDYQKPRAQEWFMRVRERLRAQHAAGESLSGGGPRA